MKESSFDFTEIEKTLKRDAKALNIPPGAADSFIKCTLSSAKQTLKNKKIITESDLTRAVSKELKKYHKDFAYVYQNRDKII